GKKDKPDRLEVGNASRTRSRTQPGSAHTWSQTAAVGARASATSEAAQGDSQGNWVAASPRPGVLTATSMITEGSEMRSQGSEVRDQSHFRRKSLASDR